MVGHQLMLGWLIDYTFEFVTWFGFSEQIENTVPTKCGRNVHYLNIMYWYGFSDAISPEIALHCVGLGKCCPKLNLQSCPRLVPNIIQYYAIWDGWWESISTYHCATKGKLLLGNIMYAKHHNLNMKTFIVFCLTIHA